MGIGVGLPTTVLTAPHRPDVYDANLTKFSNTCQQAQTRNAYWCYFCTTSKYGVRADGSQWESRTAGTHKQQSSYPHGEFSTEDNGFDESEHSGFKSSVKQRIWWSEDSSWDLDEDDEDDDEIETGFGFFEGSLEFSSIFKVLRGFVWMIPAVIISMLIGTESDTFFMTLALPLAQSALSMAFDSLWGTSNGSIRPKSRCRKKGFKGTARRRERKKRRYNNNNNNNNETVKNAYDYKSWVDTNIDGAEKGEEKKLAFNGWDDLDKERWSNQEIPKTSHEYEKARFNEGKLSKRGRNRSKPVFMRMLVALFPFLEFWTKLV